MAMSKGCTITLISVFAVILIIVLGIFLFWDNIKQAGINRLVGVAETQIKSNIPEGYDEEAVTELMKELRDALKENKIGQEMIQKMSESFGAASADEKFDVEESKNLLMIIEEALGKVPAIIEEIKEEVVIPDSL